MRRTALGVLLGLALSVAGVLVVGSSVEGTPRVVRVWPVVLAVGVMVACWLIQGAVMAILGRPWLGSFRVREMSRVYLASQAVAALTPFGGAELPYQVLLLRRLGLPVALGGAVITIKSIANGTVLVAGALVGVFFFSGLPAVGNWLLVAAAIAIVASWAGLEYLMRRKRRTPGGRPEESAPGWRAKLSEFFGELDRGLAQMQSQEPWALAACLGLMVLYWALYPLLGTLGLLAAGWSGEGWFLVYVAQFVLYLIVIPLSPTPGGSGAAEVGFAALVSPYVPQGALLGGLLIWRALNHYSEVVVGSFFAGRDVERELRAARHLLGHGRRDA